MLNKIGSKFGSGRSAIRELSEKGSVLKEQYGIDKVYDFSLGNPSVSGPKVVNETIISMLQNDDYNSIHGYTHNAGDTETRKIIASNLNKRYDADIDYNYVQMTNGAAAALSISIHAIIDSDANEEVIVFVPFFPEYTTYIEHANAKIIKVNPDIKTFYPDLNDFENKITEKTKIVILNSPNNPTGVLYKEDMIKKITSILTNKQKEYGHPIYLLSDEPYRELIFVNEKYPFITKYYDNSLITYSYSKSLSLPGERVGYIVLNKKMEDVDNVFKSIRGMSRCLGYVCATSLFQMLLKKIDGTVSDINVYKKNGLLLLNGLREIGYEVIEPSGAFYLFVKTLEPSDKKFSERALAYNLLLVPSESFGITGYVRIAYCVSEMTIRNSMKAFTDLYNSYKK